MVETSEGQLVQHILRAAEVVDKQLDDEINRLCDLDEDELDKLRQKRLIELKKEHRQTQEWLSLGHGEYSELGGEKDFFDVIKKSQKVVVHFYLRTTPRCKILDRHLKILARQHLETRFLKIDGEKSPFLSERLSIKVIPTLLAVVQGIAVDRILGFTELGNVDGFSTEMLEWRLAQSGVIEYLGDLLTPPDQRKVSKTTVIKKKERSAIRDGKSEDEEDDTSTYCDIVW
jgi:hypothetical protein